MDGDAVVVGHEVGAEQVVILVVERSRPLKVLAEFDNGHRLLLFPHIPELLVRILSDARGSAATTGMMSRGHGLGVCGGRMSVSIVVIGRHYECIY